MVAGIAAGIGGEVARVTGVTGVPPVEVIFLESMQVFSGRDPTAAVVFLSMMVHLLSK